MVHPRPQTPQGESVAKPETPLLIILSIACKYEVHVNLISPLFEKQSLWTKHPREVVKIEIYYVVSHIDINIYKYVIRLMNDISFHSV